MTTKMVRIDMDVWTKLAKVKSKYKLGSYNAAINLLLNNAGYKKV